MTRIILLCLLVYLGPDTSWAAAPRPNIVLFLVDDMGWQDTSVPFADARTPFNDHFRTPHMERLARTGIRFTQARSHPVCSPTRVSIMTGQSPARHHVTNWILKTDEPTDGKQGPVGPPAEWRREGIQEGEVTLASLLREAGYRTIHVGKAHWGAVGTSGSDPAKLGFDVNIGGHTAGSPGSYQGAENYGNKSAGQYTPPWGVPGLEVFHGEDVHLTDALTERANDAVTAAANEDKPFFLHFAHYGIHTPIQPHARFMDHYTGNYPGTERDIPSVEEKYASMMEGVDASLGALLAQLEKLGIAEETLILFTSDNGGLSAHTRGETPMGSGLNTHCWPLRAGKGSAYEGGTRVPLLLSWAARSQSHAVQQTWPIEAASTCTQPTLPEDIFITLLSVAGGTALLPEGYPTDAHSFAPQVFEKAPTEEHPLVFHYPHVWGPQGPGYEPHSAGVFGRWKVIYFYNAARWELYDLTNDVGEASDLASREPERLRELATRLRDELESRGAQWPVMRDTDEACVMRLPV